MEPLPPSFSRSFLFHKRVERRLLITGGEGSGKTIQLLEFVKDLMPRGARVAKDAIPVVLFASSWVDKPGAPPERQQGIRQWLDKEFLDRYGFPQKRSAEFLGGVGLIFCIDGIDEIGGALSSPAPGDPESAARAVYRKALRARFIALLADFIRAGEHDRFLLCCRSEISPELEPLRDLKFCDLRISALSPDEVMACLERNNLGLLRALCARPDIMQDFGVPLQLQIFATVHRGNAAPLDVERLTRRAWADYDAFKETTYKDYFDSKLRLSLELGKQDGAGAGFTGQQYYHHVRRIARYLQNTGKPAFRLDRLQPFELPHDFRASYLWMNAAVFLAAVLMLVGLPCGVAVASGFGSGGIRTGLTHGALATLGVGLGAGGIIGLGYRYTKGWKLGACIGLAFALGRAGTVGLSANVPGSMSGLPAAQLHGLLSLLGVPIFAWILHSIQEDPSTIVPIEAWRTDRRKLGIALSISAVLGAIMWFALGPARGISFGSSLALMLGIRFSKKETDLLIQVRPNQAIEFSAREAWKHTAGITAAAVAIFGASYGYWISPDEGLNNAALALSFLLSFFFFGGIAVLKHWALRATLAKARLLPWKAEGFLSAAVRAGMLRQIGGGYLFPHNRIRDYFAGKVASETWGSEDPGRT